MKQLICILILGLILNQNIWAQKSHHKQCFNSGIIPPEGWTIEDPAAPTSPRWHFSHSHHASGQYQELQFINGGEVGFRFISPVFNLSNYTNLHLSFKQLINASNIGGEVHIQTRSNNGIWSTVWSRGLDAYFNNTTSEQISIEILGVDIQNENFQFCFFVDSPSFSINNWYIDDIDLYSNLNHDLAVSKVLNNKHWVNDAPIVPQIEIYNNSINSVQQLPLKLKIYNYAGEELYDQSMTIEDIESNAISTVSFPEFNFPEDDQMYMLQVFLDNYTDDNGENDTILFYIDNYSSGRQDILKEFSTGTWCQYCPNAVHGLEQMEEEGIDNLAVIEYHEGDEYENQSSHSRLIDYYKTTAYPSSYTNGAVGGYTYNGQMEAYNEQMQFGSAIELFISGEAINGSTYDVDINIVKHLPFVDDYTILHLALTESNIPEEWYGEAFVQYVNRHMYPDENGILIDLMTPEEDRYSYSISLDNGWVPQECELVAFLQNKFTGEVYQAKMAHLTALPMKSPELTFIPENASTNIPIDFQFSILSDIPLRNIDDSEITNGNLSDLLIFKNEIGEDIPFTSTINDEKTTISISANSPLAYEAHYTLEVFDFENYDGIPGMRQVSSFTTQSEVSVPYIVFSPLDGAVLVSIDTPIEISFSQAVRNLDDSSISSSDIQDIMSFKQADNDLPFYGVINSSNDKITIIPTQFLEVNKTYTVTVSNVENFMDMAIETQSSSFTTGYVGVFSMKKENEASFYPNPARSNLVIDFSNGKELPRHIEVLDVIGNILINKSINDVVNQQLNINLSGIKAKVLLVRLKYSDKTTVNKIIKH